jgi:hypothetical protein
VTVKALSYLCLFETILDRALLDAYVINAIKWCEVILHREVYLSGISSATVEDISMNRVGMLYQLLVAL